jgi:cyclomaltodextrinase / maltogenic alpha-amylase / neopullulanase
VIYVFVRLNNFFATQKSFEFGPLLSLLATALLFGCANVGTQKSNAPSATTAAQTLKCSANPVGNRDLYLRGTFNGWNAVDAQKFVYLCNRFELVTSIKGEHTFKVGDEDWTAGADFGAGKTAGGAPWLLVPKGEGIHHSFSGDHRLILAVTDGNKPGLKIETCSAPPLGETILFLRGSMNNWTALDDYAFQFSCDAYYLNVKLSGRHEFKIADAAMKNPTTLGGKDGAVDVVHEQALTISSADRNQSGNIHFAFDGEYTIRLDYTDVRPVLTVGAKSFADSKAVGVTDPVALNLVHDSRKLADKSPFGAVTEGTTISFAIAGKAGVKSVTLVVEKRRMEGNQEVLEYAETARIPLAKLPNNDRDIWRGTHAFSDIGVFGYYFEVVIVDKTGDKTFIYQNNRDSIYWTREKGSNGLGAVEEKPTSRKSIRRFRQTVFAKDFVVPAWAKDVVYYYIFPERFRNGDMRNDPKPGVTTYQDQGVEFHQNWLDKPYKPKTGDGSDDVFNNDFFGGDLAGIIDKLDYIADLGANTIYMTPVFRAASNHKYDTTDYKNIDPNIGTNADFERLTREAAKRGIRIIPDTSLNHAGSDSLYFDRYAKYKSQGAFEGAKVRRNSPYASWFKFDENQTDTNKQYQGWVGVSDLPEINKSSPSFRDFAYGANDSVTKTWLDRGAAGWRMDVAPWVPDDFWREWRSAVKTHKPDALTIAETWFDSSKFFLGDMFDSTMNYILRNTLLDYANGGKAKNIYHNIELIREAYPPQAFYALMNLTSSHDQPRALHQFGYTDEKTDAVAIALAKQRQRLAVFFQMTFPGAPTIYYGDEVGVTGSEDPYNRATYPWADLGGTPDNVLLADFKALIKLRKDNPVLRHGTIDAPIFIDDNVIVLLRQLDNTLAITATNNAAIAKTIVVTLPDLAKSRLFVNPLTNEQITVATDSITLQIPPLFGTVLFTK